VTDKPSKEPHAKPPDPLATVGDNDRPTINPPFDVEAFARAASAPSEQPLAISGAPTNRPPPPAGAEFESEPRTERITLTDEVEQERARAQPAARPPRSSGALALADALSPSASRVEPITAAANDGGPAPTPAPSSIEDAVLDAIGESAPPEITERTIEDPVSEMRERFSLGDYTGALEMSELILAEDPDHIDAAECGKNCRTVLENMYAARLGPLDRVPMVLVQRAQMRWLSMDHRAGFVLSLIDGSSSVEMILDVSGMPKLDALRILHELVQQKIVSFP
jgi:hypothetical protein